MNLSKPDYLDNRQAQTILTFLKVRNSYMLAKKTVKNQITLPKKIVDAFPDTDYFDVKIENGKIVLNPVQPGQAEQVRDKLASLGIAEQDIEYAVSWARKDPA